MWRHWRAPRTARGRLRPVALAPWGIGLGAGALALGPALGPGFALRYDMVFVPDPPLSAVTLGGGDGFPRAVPSDAVVGALNRILPLPADAVQALVLLAIFMIGAAGAARLVPGRWVVPRLAAAVFYVWNPFVAERLLLGQWAMLLGYAGLPWVLGAVVRSARLSRLVVALVPAAVGGFSSVVLSAVVAFPAAVARGGRPGRRWRPWTAGAAVAKVAGGLLVVSLPWLIPALESGARTDPAAVDLFAPRADTPFGTVGSLLMLGGVWNAQAVPEWYGHPFVAACRLLLVIAALWGWVWLVRRHRPDVAGALTGAAAIGFAIALLGVTDIGRELLRGLIAVWPGFGPLRDGQLYVAPLALLQAVGFGGAVKWLRGDASDPRDARGDEGDAGGRAPAGAGGPAVVRADAGAGGRAGARGIDGVRGHAEVEARGEPLSSSQAEPPATPPLPPSTLWTGRRGDAAGAFAALLLLLAPLVLLPGLAWGAAGRLAPVDYPAEWRQVQRVAAADPAPGAVLVLPWSAYRGVDWAGGGRTIVVLDPATKLFGRRVVWNDDLRVAESGKVHIVEGEDPLARRAAEVIGADGAGSVAPEQIPASLRAPGAAARLGGLGIRYMLVEREAVSSSSESFDPASEPPSQRPTENKFLFASEGAEMVHDGARLALIRLPDEHVAAVKDHLSLLEVTVWLVTVGAILWSCAESGSNLVLMRPARSAGAESRKESSQ
ncbi:hypothetical protein GCM10009799_27020 [Nocardiopsis rhodophaea]|uniref:Uncharacterized protein n=1 Tax=Nocardiopsis rhodophaea TaxID=280238 RepID=A0ABN2T6K1_9ACTN